VGKNIISVFIAQELLRD